MNVQIDLGAFGFFAFLGPVTGVIVYYAIKGRLRTKYRNFTARYTPERDVARAVTHVVTHDEFIDTTVIGLPEVLGRNDHTPEVRAAFAKVTKR